MQGKGGQGYQILRQTCRIRRSNSQDLKLSLMIKYRQPHVIVKKDAAENIGTRWRI